MLAIIAVHTIGSSAIVLHQQRASVPLQFAAQTLKFGTIAFFLVAGFLFGERIDQYTSLQYYGRRLTIVLVPWAAWYLLYCSLRTFHKQTSWLHPGAQLWATISTILPDTVYWFVPNLLIALAILLLFRPLLKDIRIGIVFLLASVFYATNIYGGWLWTGHTKAVFGFVFYLWLGAWGAWHFAALDKWLSKISPGVLIGLALLTNLMAFGETRLLAFLHSADPMNSLRITNQIYSVVMVLVVMKIKRVVWPRFVDVRAHTFGLYLTHTIGLSLFGAAMMGILSHMPSLAVLSRWPWIAMYIPIVFVVNYGGCLLLVKYLLSQSWLRWSVGVSGKPRQAQGRAARGKLPFGCEYASAGVPIKADN